MAYDAVAESIKLIESRSIEGPTRLSRRRRFVPLAVDVEDDVAVTAFMRRSVGCHELDLHFLQRRYGQWHLLGGGGGSDDLDELARTWSKDQRGHFGEVNGGGWIDLNADRRMPWGQRPAQSAWLDLASEVAAVELNGRTLAVPWHHHVAVLWRGQGVPHAVLKAADGSPLARLRLR